MVKAIFSSSIVRKAAATAMFATAVLGANASNLKTENATNNINQTEVVSKAGAAALQANAVKKETTSFMVNKKIADKFIASCETEEEIEETKASIKRMFDEHGTFAATLEGQINLDEYMGPRAFGNLAIYPDFVRNVGANTIPYLQSEYTTWLKEEFYKDFLPYKDLIYEKGPAPSAEKCMQVLDSYIADSKAFKALDDKESTYVRWINTYVEKVNNYYKNNPEKFNYNQVLADQIAIRVHTLFKMAAYNFFLEQFENAGFELRMSFNEYYDKEFYRGMTYPEVEVK